MIIVQEHSGESEVKMFKKIELKLVIDAVVPDNFEDLKYADKIRYIQLQKENCIIRIKEVVIRREGLQ